MSVILNAVNSLCALFSLNGYASWQVLLDQAIDAFAGSELRQVAFLVFFHYLLLLFIYFGHQIMISPRPPKMV